MDYIILIIFFVIIPLFFISVGLVIGYLLSCRLIEWNQKRNQERKKKKEPYHEPSTNDLPGGGELPQAELPQAGPRATEHGSIPSTG